MQKQPEDEPEGDTRTLAEAHLDIGLGNNYRIEYIKHLMSISAGAFVFSVTFTKDILGSDPITAPLKVALLVGWAALAASAIAGIFHMRLWAQYYISWGLNYEKQSAKQWRSKVNRWRKIADAIQVGGFVVGLAAMLVFATSTMATK
jgi:hypothetical protein